MLTVKGETTVPVKWHHILSNVFVCLTNYVVITYVVTADNDATKNHNRNNKYTYPSPHRITILYQVTTSVLRA